MGRGGEGWRRGNSRIETSEEWKGGGEGLVRLMAKAFNPISPEWKFTSGLLSLSPRLSKFPSSPRPSLSSLNTEKGSKEDEQTTSQGFPNPTPAPALWNWLRCSLHVLISILFYAFQPDPVSLFRFPACRARRKSSRNGRDAQIWAKFARFQRAEQVLRTGLNTNFTLFIHRRINESRNLSFSRRNVIPPLRYRFVNKTFTTTNLIERLLCLVSFYRNKSVVRSLNNIFHTKEFLGGGGVFEKSGKKDRSIVS